MPQVGGGIYEALSFLVFRYISCADYGYMCNTTQEVSLCQRHMDFCALLDDDINQEAFYRDFEKVFHKEQKPVGEAVHL